MLLHDKENAVGVPFSVHCDNPASVIVSPRTEQKPKTRSTDVDLTSLLSNVSMLSQRSADAAAAVDSARSIAQSRQREAEDARRALVDVQREAQREHRALEAERDEAEASAQALRAQLESTTSERTDLTAEVARLQSELRLKGEEAQRDLTRQLEARAHDGEEQLARLRCEVEAAKLSAVTAQTTHLVAAQRARLDLSASKQVPDKSRLSASPHLFSPRLGSPCYLASPSYLTSSTVPAASAARSCGPRASRRSPARAAWLRSTT